MKRKHLFWVCSIIAVSTFFYAFKPSQSKVSYQHMMILAEHYDLDDVYISIDGKEYSHQKKLKRESQGSFDMNPIINLIHQYEGEGWELQTVSASQAFHYFWLRREK